MNCRNLGGVAVGLALALPGLALGQIGMLDSRTQYATITGSGINNQHGPLLAMVLWRGEPGWYQPRSPTERARSDSIYRWTNLHADEAGQSFFGSGLWYGLLDADRKTVTVEGTRFALSEGDSALVIMVTVPPDHLPRSVASARISAELPSDFWTKQWHRGDTTFLVHADFRRQQAMLREALDRSPAVAAFLR